MDHEPAAQPLSLWGLLTTFVAWAIGLLLATLTIIISIVFARKNARPRQQGGNDVTWMRPMRQETLEEESYPQSKRKLMNRAFFVRKKWAFASDGSKACSSKKESSIPGGLKSIEEDETTNWRQRSFTT